MFRLSFCLWMVSCAEILTDPQDKAEFFSKASSKAWVSVRDDPSWCPIEWKDSLHVQGCNPYGVDCFVTRKEYCCLAASMIHDCKAPWDLRLGCKFVHLTDCETTKAITSFTIYQEVWTGAVAGSSRSGASRSLRGGRRPQAEVVLGSRG